MGCNVDGPGKRQMIFPPFFSWVDQEENVKRFLFEWMGCDVDGLGKCQMIFLGWVGWEETEMIPSWVDNCNVDG